MTNLVIHVVDGNVAGALTKLKRLALRTGLLKDVRRHDFYRSPSEARRRKSKVARTRAIRLGRRRLLNARTSVRYALVAAVERSGKLDALIVAPRRRRETVR